MRDRDERPSSAEAPVRGAGGAAKAVAFRVAAAGGRLRLAAGIDALRLRLAATLERELDAGRGFLWLPVAFGTGIVTYFALPREPAAWALVGLAVVLGGLAWRARRRVAVFRVLVILAAVAAGMTAIKLRTDRAAAPVLPREMTATVTGFVADVEAAARGGVRIVLRVAGFERLAPAATPRLVRVTVRSRGAAIAVGDALSLRARLSPPSGPVIPGGYDFARAAFYDGLGAIGFAYGAPKRADLGEPPMAIALARPVADLRALIRARIVAALPGDNGEIAAALIMGDQGGISERAQEAMRASGLGHVLSISGLHMALVAGSAFWLIRALLALSAGLALRRPIKKWAAAGALVVAAFYLAISGGGVATERAFVMLAVMLTAILLDRRAITLRNVALAALIVLAIEPESVLSASFQMSFAATLALVAGFEVIALRRDRRLTLADPGSPRLSGRASAWIAGLFLTSLIAGLATTPFGAYHFQRLAPLSLFANLAAMPAVGFVVMPMALVSVILMPFGLEPLPLAAMSLGLDWMMAVAATAEAWSEGIGAVRMAPPASLVLFVAGFLWLALWRERWRFAGLLPMLLALPVALLSPRPDILIDDSGEAVAVRSDDGRYVVIGVKGHRFEVETWLRTDGDPRDSPSEAGEADGARCDPLGCTIAAGGVLVAVGNSPAALADDCRLATVVISRYRAPDGCAAAAVIDRSALASGGAHALYRIVADGPPRFQVVTAYPPLRRPFMPPAAGAQP